MESQTKPILLYNDECGVCRHIAHWVDQSAAVSIGEPSLLVQPIGEDPKALRALNPTLGIWDAYATIHLLMPDGSMKLGGEAVAEVLRKLRGTQWFAWTFAVSIFGFRPFQGTLNLAYAILADIRPLFGCESCGTPSFWMRPLAGMIRWAGARFRKNPGSKPISRSTLLPGRQIQDAVEAAKN
jgi:predicted DCC family thiol-disulfide oxidoreductase YuxK